MDNFSAMAYILGMETISAEGFIVHAYSDSGRNRVHILGRLTDGRSFAASVGVPPLCLYIRRENAVRAEALFAEARISVSPEETDFVLFDGSPCLVLEGSSERDVVSASRILQQKGIEVFGLGVKNAAAFLIRKGIRGGFRLRANAAGGRASTSCFPTQR